MVADDVRHAYGSVVHDTLKFLLQVASFPDALVDLLLLATTSATVYMGGSSGVSEALARCGFGLPSICDGVLCCSGSTLFPGAPHKAPLLGARRPLQSDAVHGQHHVVYRPQRRFAGFRG